MVLDAPASSLRLIPLFYNGQYNEWQNEGRAITPDGAYVAGVEYQSNTVYRAWMDGIFYNVTNNTVDSPLSSTSPPRILTGIGYRTSGGQKQVVAAGYDQSNFVQSEWMTANGGQTWGTVRRNTSFTECINPALANSLGSIVGLDKYYVIVGSANTSSPGAVNDQRHLYTGLASGSWPATMNLNNQYFAIDNPDAGNLCGVACSGPAAGRAVGWYQHNPYGSDPNTYRSNCVVDYPPAGPVGFPQSYAQTWSFNGLNNAPTNGECWAISADGTQIFGRSTTLFDTNWHAYKAIVGTTKNSWTRTDRLPDFPNTAGSQYLACPYGCTPDGRYAVGMSYRGVERAVIWDTGNVNPANWVAVDLTDAAAAEGLLGSSWGRLIRAYSVGVNAAGDPVITGYGAYTDSHGTWNRAFVMTLSRCAFSANAAAIATPVYNNASTVTVTNCNPAATAIKIYRDGSLIGSATGGSATVIVTVTPPALVAGWTLKVTQTLYTQESCLSTAPSAVVTTPANPPPVVTMDTPANNAYFIAPTNIILAATVTSNYNTINYVSFYRSGTNLIATVSAAPFAFTWVGVPVGSYSLHARVGYNSGLTVDSAPALITVDPPPPGSTLVAIPIAPWIAGQYHNQGRAISPDGRYVVGPCYSSSAGDGDGFMYDVATGNVVQPSGSSYDSYPPNMLTGVGYRTDSVNGKQLILDGMYFNSSVGGYRQANWSTIDGGATWGARRADTSVTDGFSLPAANSLGAVTGSDKFFTLSGNSAADLNNQREVYICKGSNTWNSSIAPSFSYNWFYIDNPDAGNLCGVAGATGRAVGWYRDNWTYSPAQVKYNCVVEYPPPGSIGWPASYAKTWFFRGLANTNMGTAWSVSADGLKIFGHSPTPTDSRWHGYKALVTAATNSLQAIYQLPDFADTSGSVTLAVPYGCTMDGRYAVGMNYHGPTPPEQREKAVLWDTGNADPAKWTVLDLTDQAASEGILGNFTRLSRAYSVGTNGFGNPVITGIGDYDDGTGTYTRAFVMVLGTPRPQITSILEVGSTSITVSYASAIPGKTYTLQYNTNLNALGNWYSVSSKTAMGTSDSQTQTGITSGTRFYRVYCP